MGGGAPLNKPGLNSLDTSSQGVDPSDSTGGVSPTNYIEAVNSTVGRYSKTNLTNLEKTDLTTFVGGISTCDPQFQWDPAVQRWLYAAIRCDNTTTANQLYLGWSNTATPTLATVDWCRWVLNTGTITADYPKLGHDDVHGIIGTNEFSPTSYVGSKIRAFPVPASGQACPASLTLSQLTTTTTGTTGFTPVPANTVTGSATGFVTSAPFSSGSQLNLWQVTGAAGATPVIASAGNVTVPAWSAPANVPQKGTTNVLDSSDTRETQAVAAADPGAGGALGLWTQHTVDDGAGHSMVRWYEILPATATLQQTGTINPSGTLFAFNGAISPTASGSSAIIQYNTSSATTFPDVRAQSRISTTPAGTTTGELILARSPTFDASFTCTAPNGPPCRWGDYAAANPDPSNTNQVWGTNMLLKSGVVNSVNWTTQNFALTPAKTSVSVSGGVLNIVADPGIPNRMKLVTSGSNVQVTDAASSLLVGAGCSLLASGAANCPSAGLSSATVNLGDQGDTFTATAPLPLNLSSGTGNDTLSTLNTVVDLSIDAGAGTDRCDKEVADPAPIACETVINH